MDVRPVITHAEHDVLGLFFVFFKQKTAYDIKECDWSSDVCSSDLCECVYIHTRMGCRAATTQIRPETWRRGSPVPGGSSLGKGRAIKSTTVLRRRPDASPWITAPGRFQPARCDRFFAKPDGNGEERGGVNAGRRADPRGEWSFWRVLPGLPRLHHGRRQPRRHHSQTRRGTCLPRGGLGRGRAATAGAHLGAVTQGPDIP